jgi:hypothetical protein
MRKAVVIITLFLCSVTPCDAASEKSVVKLDVNWLAFMAQHDLIWDRVPEDYFAGAFVGNGLLGTILFKDDIEPNTLRFEIGRTDVYDHRIKGANAYKSCRLPSGKSGWLGCRISTSTTMGL